MALQEESELEREKGIKYRGTARIRLKWLCFQRKGFDVKNVQHLMSCFQKDCRRLDIRNHIPAVISQEDLDSALQVSDIPHGIMLTVSREEYSELGFWIGYQLECLHGRHRIRAAKHCLLPSDKW